MTDWSSVKVVDLRAELSNRGLSTKGLKVELVQRLTEADAATAAQPEKEPEPEVEDNAPEKAALPAVDDGVSNEITERQSESKADDIEMVDAMATQDTLTQPDPALPPPTSQEPASSGNSLAQIAQDDPPTSDAPLTSTDAVADLQKRKRRSITPQPSVKRARQEDERLVESGEGFTGPKNEHIITDNQNSNHTTSASSKKSPNGAEKRRIASEDVDMTCQEPYTTVAPVAKDDGDSLEVSGEDAYAKRVAIAESLNLRSTSLSQSRGQSLARSEEGVHDKHMTPAEDRDMSAESGEHAYAKRVAIAESSELRSGAPSYPSKSQPPYEYAEHDNSHRSQGIKLEGRDESSLPSQHSPTSALYIRELMRPLKSEAMEQYIVDLISSSAKDPDADPIHDFYLDQIRTHAFVSLPSISAAQLVRAALHNQVWPNERNRKALWVDFIPAESMKDWIEQEESAPRGARWEVVYEQSGGSVVAVHREVGLDTKSFSRPPPTGPAASAAGPVHVYPGIQGAPRGPRGGNGGGVGGGRAIFQNPSTRQTDHLPQLIYTPKDEDLVRRRIDNMRYFYSRDPPPDLGKDYHRFTFEFADAFVDRGKEVFIGIRPPHRQREHEERLAAGDGSLPPRRPPVTDETRFDRHGNGRRSNRPDWPPRNRGSRTDRGPGRYRGEDPYRYRPGY